jgi:hypothetical protein
MESQESGIFNHVKLVFFNGPPRSGKDVAANITIHEIFDGAALHMKFAAPIKAAVNAFLNVFYAKDVEFFYETEAKNQPQPRFFDQTPREVLISFSEDWAKPQFGADIFGQLALRTLQKFVKLNWDLFVFSDSGFQHEFDVLYKICKPTNILVVQMHREDCTFNGDSRNYIDPRDAHRFVIHNNETLGALQEAICSALADTWPELITQVTNNKTPLWPLKAP